MFITLCLPLDDQFNHERSLPRLSPDAYILHGRGDVMNQSYLTIRYYALAGTMLAATMLPSATAYAATVTSTGNETWAGTAAQTSANVPTARLDDNLFINGSHTISILNNGVANDGRGTSLMSVGTVTDSGAVNSVLRFEALNGPLTASVVSITDIQSLQAVTTSGHQASISVNGNVSLDNALSMTSSLAGSPLTLSITGNASANTATIQSTSTGTTRLSVGGNLSTTGAITLDSSANQSVLQLNGSIAQTVSGVIQGNSAGQGTVSITNTHANGVTFNNSIGAANSIHSIVIGSGTSNTKAQFKANVRTSNGITLGDGGGTVQTATAVFDMAGGGITINGTINSDGTDTGNVTIQGNNWATVTSSWGQTGNWAPSPCPMRQG